MRPQAGTMVVVSPRNGGYTLLEVLIVLAIATLLLALTLPAVQRTRAAAARVGCKSNLRQIALAVHAYSDSYGQLPPGCGYPVLSPTRRIVPLAGISWQTSILPYIDEAPLWQVAWDSLLQNPQGNDRHFAELAGGKVVPLFVWPADGRQLATDDSGWVWGLTSYLGVAGTSVHATDGVFHPNFNVRLTDISDGTSMTLMIGERPPGPNGVYGGWYADWGKASRCPLVQILSAGNTVFYDPEATGCTASKYAYHPGQLNNLCDVNHYWSLHTGGANFAFADGSVRFLPYTKAAIMPALATRADGEVVDLD
jgi:prepilin-type processing-associated H-X9-DG protein/prepilin-type N-terminal cleavage/methylation domain-containing protein